jgi:Tfp pilus assembly protein PilP
MTLGLGIMIAAAAPGALAQVSPSTPNSVKSALQGAAKPAQQPAKPAAKPAAPAATKPAPQAAKPAAPAATKPAAQAAKRAAKPAAKPTAKSSAKPVAKAPVNPAAKKAAAPRTSAPAESEVRMARRDPFESLVGRQQGKGAPNLPPGKAGLQVSTLRLDGIVKAPNGMIAVVSNPQARTYFLREGDHLYDGTVEKISMDGVSFHEEGKDAFGKPMERQVNKRIYSSSGEQQ